MVRAKSGGRMPEPVATAFLLALGDLRAYIAAGAAVVLGDVEFRQQFAGVLERVAEGADWLPARCVNADLAGRVAEQARALAAAVDAPMRRCDRPRVWTEVASLARLAGQIRWAG